MVAPLVASVFLSTAAQAEITELSVLYDGLAPAIVTIVTKSGEARGLGTGVVVHKEGLIVTAAHVIDGVAKIEVHFLKGAVRTAQIVTLSRTEDLALIRVSNLPPMGFIPELGDSDLLEVGQPVFMIGTPLGLTHTVTEGIISGLRKTHRQAAMRTPYIPEKLIQTDAAMNQGNSGGAVFNEDGQVVGIASFIASPSGGSVGLGFAIPSNAVRRRLFEQALPYIGVSLRRVPKPLAETLHWPAGAMLIERVDEDSAAAEAGLRGGGVEANLGGLKLKLGGDLIIKVGGLDVSEARKVHTYLHGLKKGDTLEYVVLRGGKLMKASIKIPAGVELPDLPPPTPFKQRAKPGRGRKGRRPRR